MAYSRLDPRNNQRVSEIVQRIAHVNYIPLVHEHDMLEIEKVFRSIPSLDFPINSAAELIEKLGGSGKEYTIAEVNVDPMRMIKYMPSYYFPIASIENFIEKLADLIRDNRKQVDVPREMESIRRYVAHLQFPIRSAEELSRQMNENEQYAFQGRYVNAREMIKKIPEEVFPFESPEDFEMKIMSVMVNRPLIVRD
ncbi:hypothetical protein I2I11_16975 [Pontibacter sp. 172403-2]|uniref:MTH865 family protein n=1 Tax=Pontibacter rufus TaxID=2791028 RepID=UPI0018AFFFAA|nr:MTH865 family protein [Pontibacter sp. 172403-2]MBF9255000.1 hypothetical protein [Pontibacter sp. 172403-2]